VCWLIIFTVDQTPIQCVPFKTEPCLLHETLGLRNPLNSSSRVPLLQLMHCLKSVRPWFQLLFFSMSTCHRHFLLSEKLLPIGVFLSYSVLPCRDSHRYVLPEQQQGISKRSNVAEWTHVLPVNTQCSNLYSFCTAGVSSGLATRTRVWGGKLCDSITLVGLLLISFLCRSSWLLFGSRVYLGTKFV
jgi:hypothetical protein